MQGTLQIIAKKIKGQPHKSKIEVLEDPRCSSPYLLTPPGTTDKKTIATGGKTKATKEIRRNPSCPLLNYPIEKKLYVIAFNMLLSS
jgi:hypothetical protein